jgi:hypothetical protein
MGIKRGDNASMNLTASRVRELLNYDPETGVMTWVVTPGRRTKAGRVAGSLKSDGYVKIGVLGKRYPAHRLAWLYMTGEWPKNQIDHMDGKGANNAWNNLRDVPQKVNSQNLRRCKITNSTGLLGVSRTKWGFVAEIQLDGKKHHIGVFETPVDAHAAYLEAKRSLHEGCTI